MKREEVEERKEQRAMSGKQLTMSNVRTRNNRAVSFNISYSSYLIYSLLFVFCLSACSLGGDVDTWRKKMLEANDVSTPNETTVDFTSHVSNYSIKVGNNSGERIVAFKADLRDDTLIGGIPAYAQNHGLPKNPALFDKTEYFTLILLTEAQYNANKNMLGSLMNKPFTRALVFYSHNGDNSAVYEIAGALGGTNTLLVSNSGSINVELRIGSANGEILGYVPAGMLEAEFRLQDGDYGIFPVIKRYNSLRGIVEEIYPRTNNNSAWYQAISFGEGITTTTINVANILGMMTKFTSRAAWVIVDNHTSSGGIMFMTGSTINTTVTGQTDIMNGSPGIFRINMPKLGNSYAESMTVNNWRFGPLAEFVALTGDVYPDLQGTFEINQDKIYTVTVTGNANEANSLKAWVSDVADLPLDLTGN